MLSDSVDPIRAVKLPDSLSELIGVLAPLSADEFDGFFGSLSEDDLGKLRVLLTPKWSRYIPRDFRPTPKQLLFLLADNREVFFGGQGGAGKTVTLLAAGLQYADVPGYSGIIIMKNYPNLEHVIGVAKEWLYGTGAVWHEQKHKFTFTEGGQLSFGNVDRDDDVYKYRSFEFHYMAFDEVTRLTGDQYLKLTSRVRKTKDDPIPLRIRSASNPGGGIEGHAFIKERFVDPDTRKEGSLYIPASMFDNPHLDTDEYVQILSELPLVERERILHGNWDISENGILMNKEWFKIVNDPEPNDWDTTVRIWDVAASIQSKQNNNPDYTAGAL